MWDCVFSHEALGREFAVVARLTRREVTAGKPRSRSSRGEVSEKAQVTAVIPEARAIYSWAG